MEKFFELAGCITVGKISVSRTSTTRGIDWGYTFQLIPTVATVCRDKIARSHKLVRPKNIGKSYTCRGEGAKNRIPPYTLQGYCYGVVESITQV